MRARAGPNQCWPGPCPRPNQCEPMQTNANQCNQCKPMRARAGPNQCGPGPGSWAQPMRAPSPGPNQCKPMQTNANRCKPMQTNANQCKPMQPMQTNADQCKQMQPMQTNATNANQCNDLSNIINNEKHLAAVSRRCKLCFSHWSVPGRHCRMSF